MLRFRPVSIARRRFVHHFKSPPRCQSKLSPDVQIQTRRSNPPGFKRNIVTMSASQQPAFTQPEHPLVLIPGPVELDDAVLGALAHSSESHVSPDFVQVFSKTLKQTRHLFQTSNPDSQPFILSGSGTLGFDQVAANLSEPGDAVLVLTSGYFGDSFADCFRAYRADVTQLTAPVGQAPDLGQLEDALKAKKYSIVTVTHVDTSTGVLSNVKGVAETVRRLSPDALVVVDGVCSVGCEELRFDDWDLDVVLTASQKAIGAPSGLSLLVASGRAMSRFDQATAKGRPAQSYFAAWGRWRPIMQAYEAGKPSYFATPSPHLVRALHTSLTAILAAGPTPAEAMQTRWHAHQAASDKVKDGIGALGLAQVAANPDQQAHGMTAAYWPESLVSAAPAGQPVAAVLLPKLASRGVVLAGGLHKQIAPKYFRIGHMGVSATDLDRGHLDRLLEQLGAVLKEAQP